MECVRWSSGLGGGFGVGPRWRPAPFAAAPIAAAAPVAFNWQAAPAARFNPIQYCGYWSQIGECGRNPNWMLSNCQTQCYGSTSLLPPSSLLRPSHNPPAFQGSRKCPVLPSPVSSSS